jgi:hypothetical protein
MLGVSSAARVLRRWCRRDSVTRLGFGALDGGGCSDSEQPGFANLGEEVVSVEAVNRTEMRYHVRALSMGMTGCCTRA